MSETYQVVLTGSTEPGHEPATVAEKLSTLFRISSEKAMGLLAGNETIIKKDIDAETAAKYETAIRAAGATCVVSNAGAEPFAAPPPPPPAPEPPPQPALEPVESAAPANDGLGDLESFDPRSSGVAAAAAASPYAPPEAALVMNEVEDGDLHEPVRVSAGAGPGWISTGWSLFKTAPVAFILMMLLYMVVTIVVSLIPIIGSLAISVGYPILIAGLMTAAHRAYHGEVVAVGDLFSAFSGGRVGPLVGVGAVYLGGTILVMLLVFGVGGVVLGANALDLAQMGEQLDSNPAAQGAIMGVVLLLSLVALALMIPFMAAIWFAPVLIELHHEVTLGQALKMSFWGCIKNILPMFLYSIVLMILFIIGSLPFGLGLLVIGPIALCSMYASYRQIYIE